MVRFRILEDLDVDNKTVLLRADLNVPVKDGVVTDATRIERLAPTIEALIAAGARVVVMSHFGRPKDGPDPALTLRPLVAPLENAIGGREVEAYVGADYSFRSSVYTVATDSRYSLLPSLNLVNARVGVRAANGQWDAFVWGRNIFNTDYYNFVSAGVGNTGALYASLGDPATYGVTLRVHY